MSRPSSSASPKPPTSTDRWPSFLVIGAGKSGTTSLWRSLDQHPEVFMSPVKEPNFFALKGEDLPRDADDPERMHHYPDAVTTCAGYQALFDEAPDGAVTGEVSPMYLYDERAPATIAHHLGTDVRLVAMLRQPAERLFSRWQHLVAEGYPPSDRFRDALDRSSIWWRRPDLVPEGFYGAHLQRYLDRFPRSHLKVFLFEDLVERPKATMEALYRFLGVDPAFRPDTTPRNSSHRLQHPVLAWLLGRHGGLKAVLRSALPELWSRLRRSPTAQRLLATARRHLGHKASLPGALRRRITHEIYADDLRHLNSLLDRSLDHWFPSDTEPESFSRPAVSLHP
jgi:hypothetical protein